MPKFNENILHQTDVLSNYKYLMLSKIHYILLLRYACTFKRLKNCTSFYCQIHKKKLYE